MIEQICSVALAYTTEDFGNWGSGFGTLLIGLGTIGIAWAAVKTIPKALEKRHKSDDLIKMYQRVVYRLYREVEASSQGITFSLPGDFEQLSKLLHSTHPNLGSLENVQTMMDDLMLDGYFKTVRGNATVMVTSKWDPKDRSKKVNPDMENLPPKT
jgi:hypothetical protein